MSESETSNYSRKDINNNKANEILSGQSTDNMLQQFTNYQGMIIGSSKELALQIKDASAVASSWKYRYKSTRNN
ncbi:MAG: hypothetical protein RCG15_00695 [Candidatus Rickettsia vulgarisii]